MASLTEPGQLARVNVGAFTSEAGIAIPELTIAYRRWGELRLLQDGSSNLLLVEHALSADSNLPQWWPGLVGPGLALDTGRYCVLCSNVIGSCYGSSGPASTHPDGRAWGSRFPALSIRDLVAAEKRLLDALGIFSLRAVIGASLGGARALEWALMYPRQVASAAVIAVSAQAGGWQIGMQSAQIRAILEDPDWQNGDYYGSGRTPQRGLVAARRIAHLTYRSGLELDARFANAPQAGEQPLGPYRRAGQRFAVESYLDHQGEKLADRFDAGSYVTLTDALNRHDIARGRGPLQEVLSSIRLPVLVAGIDTDLLYPFRYQEQLFRQLGNPLGLERIVSALGHDGFLLERPQIEKLLRGFVARVAPAPPGRAGTGKGQE